MFPVWSVTYVPGPYLRSSRRAAVRWPGACGVSFSATLCVAPPGREGRDSAE